MDARVKPGHDVECVAALVFPQIEITGFDLRVPAYVPGAPQRLRPRGWQERADYSALAKIASGASAIGPGVQSVPGSSVSFTSGSSPRCR
jgi:hypothetical protein